MKSVCVVVLNYRTWQDTVECLRSLLKDPCRSQQIVVVDEGVGLEVRPTAGPASGSNTSEGYPQPLMLSMVTHSDCGAARRLMVKVHGALDRTDARTRSLSENPFFRIGLLGLLYGQNRWKRWHSYAGEYAIDVPLPVDLLSGACLLNRREARERTGLSNSLLHAATLDRMKCCLRRSRCFIPFVVALIATNLRFARLARRVAARATGR